MPDGLAVIDKAAGWTSHDVVAKARGLLGTKKVGHSGTLDPDATGVLLLGVGRATRLLRYLNDLPKTYTGEVVLGLTTSTLDASGEPTGRWDMSSVTPEEVQEELPQFVGDIEQVPPMVSAVQIGGKRLHQLAREGIEVEREPRPVHVWSYTAEPTDDPLVSDPPACTAVVLAAPALDVAARVLALGTPDPSHQISPSLQSQRKGTIRTTQR